MLPDEDVEVLWAAFTGARDEPVVNGRANV